MENYLALQAAAARPPLAVAQGHAMLRLVHRQPVTALEGAVTSRIGRFVRGARASSSSQRPDSPAAIPRPPQKTLPATRTGE